MTCKQLHGFLWLGWITLAIVVMICVASDMATVRKIKEIKETEKLEVVEELQQQIQQLQVQQQTIQQNGN